MPAEYDVTTRGPDSATETASPLALDAALADWVYHRGEKDQALTLGQISPELESYNLGEKHGDFGKSSDNFLYDTSTGFGASIVKDGNTVVIVYRGTDLISFTNFALDDLYQDVHLGVGWTSNIVNQVTDALNLFDLVKSSLAAGESIRVVGQSLGGGLAGIVAAIKGVPGTIIDPAPFYKQMNIEALKQAIRDVAPNNDASWTSIGDYELKASLSDVSAPGYYGEGLGTVGDSIYGSLGADKYAIFLQKYNTYMGRLPDKAYRIDGEALTSEYFVGTLIAVGSDHFRQLCT